MALTPAEKQKRYRERQKEAAKEAERKAAPDLTDTYLGEPFATFLTNDQDAEQELNFIGETLDSVGLDMPDLTEDADPEWRADWQVPNRGSIGRAERMVSALIDSARTLAELINRYKLQEVEQALAGLAAADLTDPEAKVKALNDVVRLTDLQKRLQREVRHAFPTISVKGD